MHSSNVGSLVSHGLHDRCVFHCSCLLGHGDYRDRPHPSRRKIVVRRDSWRGLFDGFSCQKHDLRDYGRVGALPGAYLWSNLGPQLSFYVMSATYLLHMFTAAFIIKEPNGQLISGSSIDRTCYVILGTNTKSRHSWDDVQVVVLRSE